MQTIKNLHLCFMQNLWMFPLNTIANLEAPKCKDSRWLIIYVIASEVIHPLWSSLYLNFTDA